MPRSEIGSSWLYLKWKKKPSDAPTAWPITVATAAPAVPIAGRPSQPKMNTGSSTMFVTAPAICVHMLSLDRPVDCRRRSTQISRYRKTEPIVTICR